MELHTRYQRVGASLVLLVMLSVFSFGISAVDSIQKGKTAQTVPTTNTVVTASPVFQKSTGLFSHNTSNTNNLDAAIANVPLRTVLRQLGTVTGWRIFVEPGLIHPINTKFKNLPAYEALPLIFGNLNYALVSDGKNGQRLLVFQKDQKLATEYVRPDLSLPIPNELLVILKKGSKLTPEEIAKLIEGKLVAVSKDGTTIRFRFEDEEGVAKAKEILAKLLGTDVESLENNYYMISPEAALALAQNGGLSLPKNVTALPGDSTTIAMIDSGLHLDGINYADVLLEAVNFTGEPYQLSSTPTHLDSMLGSSIFFLQSSGYDSLNINYLPLIVTDESGSGDMFSVSQAVLYASEAGVKVINIPLSGDVSSPILAAAIQTAVSNGAIIYAATGNEPTGQVTYPAGYPGVNGVTALENGAIAPYANNGSFADVAIAGTGIFYLDNSFYMTTGTSVSTTYASTVTALQMEDSGKTAQEAATAVLQKFGNKKN